MATANTSSNSSALSSVLLTWDEVRNANRGIPAPDYNAPASFERTFLTWDGVEGLTPLRGGKVMKTMWPLGSVDPGQPLNISVGGVWVTGDTDFQYVGPKAFDGTDLTEQLDFDTEGRYLSIRVDYPGDRNFTFSGFDLDIEKSGDR